jgi:hypothetical protein
MGFAAGSLDSIGAFRPIRGQHMKHAFAYVLLLLASPGFSDARSFTAAQAREDLTALYQGLQSGHFDLYAHRDKADYEQKFRDTIAQLDQALTPFDLFLVLQEFAAYGNVAHAKVEPSVDAYSRFRKEGGKAFPIYPRIVDGRLFVAEDYSGLDTLSPGDEILTLNGLPASWWLKRLTRFISADSRYLAHAQLESGFPTYLWIETGEQAEFALTVSDTNGTQQQISVPALNRDQLMQQIDTAPEVFSLDFASRDARMLGSDIAYLRPGPFYNIEDPAALWNPSTFVSFIDLAFERFLEAEAQNLIIDLRNNPGGDNSFSDPMVQWIADRAFRFASSFKVRSSNEAAASNQARIDADPSTADGMSGRYAELFQQTPPGEIFELELNLVQPRAGKRFKGEVYVLINRHSYSNAVTTAAIFKDYGWATIVGEPTADNATTYGAMEHFTLPNSGMRVGFPKALIVRPNGVATVAGVQPEMVIRDPIIPSQEDVMLAGLLAYLEQS